MSDIFLSYSREDRGRVTPLVEFLIDQGLDVWWDRDLHPGDSFEEAIDKHILDASCVVVVWSVNSINSRWVKNEALEGLEREILVPLQLDDVRLPVAFKQTQAANFTGWPDKVDEFEAESFLSAIYEKLGRETPASAPPLLATKKKTPVKLPAAIATMVLLILLAVAATWLQKEEVLTPESTTLAVLRFKDIGHQDNYLADSLSSEVFTRLKHVKALHLVSLFASWDLPEGILSSEVAERLAVRFLLDGKIIHTGPSVRLMVTLTDDDGALVWQREYDAAGSNIQHLTQRIADHLLGQLNVPVSEEDDLVINRDYTTNEGAYSFYLKGTDLLRRASSLETLQQARENFEKAIKKDNRFVLAYSGLCRVYMSLYEGSHDVRQFESAERACNRSLTLEPTQAEAYVALGDLYRYSGQADLAESQITKALRLEPDNVDAYIALGYVLTELNRKPEALAAYNLAVVKQPGYWLSFNARGVFYYQRGRYEEAIQDFTQVIYLDPGNYKALTNLGTARYLNGQFSEAIASWKKSELITPGRSVLSNLGTGYYFLRDYEQASVMFLRAVESAPEDHRVWGNLADTQRMSDRFEQAEENYRKAISLAEKDLAVNNTDAAVVSRLAVYHASIGDTQAAREYIEKTNIIGGSDPFLQYDITIALVLLEELKEAQDSYLSLLNSGFPKALIESEPMFDGLAEL